MRRGPAWALVALTAGAVLLAPAAARACSCVGFELLAPFDGQTDVPTNASMWVVSYGGPSSTFFLQGPDGQVPTSVLNLAPQSFSQRFMISPSQELKPGGSHELFACQQGRPAQLTSECQRLTRFTVGSTRAERPPVPLERSRSTFYRDGERGSSCGPDSTRLVEFQFDWQGLLLVADVDGTNPYPADPAGVLTLSTTERDYARAGHWSMGMGPCTRARLPDSAQVRFGAVNIAGEFSGWGAASTVTLPEDTGCQMGGGRGPRAPWAAGAIAIVWLMWWRRRRPARG